jgi:deoxyribodipyrimidine photo-lyase
VKYFIHNLNGKNITDYMRVFLFHRDLRLQDNTTLIKMMKASSEPITAVFIFTPEQIDPQKNMYFNHNAVQFMIESLKVLDKQITTFGGRLYYFKGSNIEIIEKINKIEKIKELGFNADYSPYALKRDKEIKEWCEKNQIIVHSEEDLLLLKVFQGDHLKKDKTPFKVFTPFRNNCWVQKIRTPDNFKDFHFTKIPSLDIHTFMNLEKLYNNNEHLIVNGGRELASIRMKGLKYQKEYEKKRNLLTYQTSLLGADLSFGTLSVREVLYEARTHLGIKSAYESELWWREFYFVIMFYFPQVIGGFFKPQWNPVEWKNNQSYINAVVACTTGFPIIDAALKQLFVTGWSHNRCRMFLTSFLAKDLLLDPRWIEKFWASHLVDYSVSATNGGVSWTVGYGTDAMIANRIFNPWTQSENFDSEGKFIKKWIPALENITPVHIHNWYKFHDKYTEIDYPSPIVDHSKQRLEFLKVLKKYNL